MIVIPEGSASDDIQHSIDSEICQIIVSKNLAINLLRLNFLISHGQALVFPSRNF